MKPFDYVRAGSAQDAVRAGAEGRFLGGGTNLVDLMKLEIEKPDRLVDVSRLGSDEIEDGPDGLRIGAGVSNSALAGHPLVRERYPLLSTALLSGATQQLRNKATVGGNFLQRTRCQYSTTCSAPATSAYREAVATRSTASIVSTPFSGRVSTASRSTPPTWRWQWQPSTPPSKP